MSKAVKTWLIAAGSLVAAGCLLFGGVMMVLKWDFTKLSTVSYETNEHVVEGGYSHISITTDTADIVFVPTDREETSVVCYEQKNVTYTVAVHNGTLAIDVCDTRKWYDHIGIHFGAPSITVYLPETEYGTLCISGSTGDVEIPKELRFASVEVTVSTGDVACRASAAGAVKIKTSTGKICVENGLASTLDLSVSTGGITVSDVTCAGDVNIRVSTGPATVTGMTCRNFTSDGDTGNLMLTNVVASGKYSIERSTGDVKLDGCDAAELFVTTDTGHVTGSLRSSKVFIVSTDTGRVDVPKTIVGGRCEITTDTGNIEFDVMS